MMEVAWQSLRRRRASALLIAGLRVLLLLLPAAILLLGVSRTTGRAQTMFGLGAGFQLVVCVLTFSSKRSWMKPLAPSVITCYVIALGWLWLGALDLADWYLHLSQAVLLVVPLL